MHLNDDLTLNPPDLIDQFQIAKISREMIPLDPLAVFKDAHAIFNGLADI